ncbi:PilZ domain-containing protein [Litorilituus lipolyticus]|uniref:PilZ domain-containing protein n=1 Tax=Litorilituus lipolyticus TaxID=2491017 RepID=A0A502KQX5_9GAMM|nr:PilZ domain-containing protein [Litorilituus lipolyticus]TPH13886.1 PilZ domain-containing protein [Litorilituus lipolyticus]
MTTKSLEEKLAQYHEFFAIEHNFSINLVSISSNIKSYEQFIAHMPMPFKLASEVSTIDQAALRPLQGLSSSAGQLVDFLNLQSQKIDLLIGYILSQQDDDESRFKGIEFGGGGIKFISDQAIEVEQLIEMKIFLLDENCAVYCIGEVIESQKINNTYHQKVTFHFIREEDRESLVRTSLHIQSKQLQKLAQQRNNEHDKK